MNENYVVTAAFGADVVYQAGGQRYFIPIIAQSGADGVEIRRDAFCRPPSTMN